MTGHLASRRIATQAVKRCRPGRAPAQLNAPSIRCCYEGAHEGLKSAAAPDAYGRFLAMQETSD